MQKIMIMSDSSCDLEPEVVNELGIKIVPFNISIGDISFKEYVDKSKSEVYELMENCAEIPKTAQVTAFEFEEIFNDAYRNGYTDVIYVSISSTGSATNSNAVMAVKISLRKILMQKESSTFTLLTQRDIRQCTVIV